MKFSAYLLQEIKEWHLLNHPFYQAWMKGELSLDQLRFYVAQYYPHVDAFPRYVSAVHSKCEDGKARAELARNLADEEGVVVGKPHPELWLDFARALGLDREAVINAKRQAACEKLVEGYFELTASSYGEGLAALTAYEYQIPAISETKIDGLKKCYGINSKEALAFFDVHREADVYHSNACLEALDHLPEEEKSKAVSAAKRSARLLWDFLTESYEPA